MRVCASTSICPMQYYSMSLVTCSSCLWFVKHPNMNSCTPIVCSTRQENTAHVNKARQSRSSNCLECWGCEQEGKDSVGNVPVRCSCTPMSLYLHAGTIFWEQLISEGARFPVGNYLNYTNARSSQSWKTIQTVHKYILVSPGSIIIRHCPRGHSDYHHHHHQIIIISIFRLCDPPNDRTPKQWLYEDHHTPAAGNGTSATACCQDDP